MIDQVGAALVNAAPAGPYEAEIARAVERVAAEQLMGLAASADMPQVRAIATLKLESARQRLQNVGVQDEAARAHAQLLARDITRFLENPDSFKRAAPIVDAARRADRRPGDGLARPVALPRAALQRLGGDGHSIGARD